MYQNQRVRHGSNTGAIICNAEKGYVFVQYDKPDGFLAGAIVKPSELIMIDPILSRDNFSLRERAAIAAMQSLILMDDEQYYAIYGDRSIVEAAVYMSDKLIENLNKKET